ncbi:MAG: vanadium-dependent haloperoxidase [Pseudomonadota bacterium]
MSDDRRQAALAYRIEAANTAFNRDHPKHKANGDEERYAEANYAMSFTKGLPHSSTTGLIVDRRDFEAFRKAIDEGFIDAFSTSVPVAIACTGLDRRRWEAPTAGLVFELEGPDPQAVSMAPAPALGSDELAYEMAEVYELALLRDQPFSAFRAGAGNAVMAAAINDLNSMPYDPSAPAPQADGSQRPRTTEGGALTEQTAFRGSSPGVAVGPYLSQFMFIGNASVDAAVSDGRINFGPQQIDQRVPVAAAQDYMTSIADWLEVQRGCETRNNTELFVNPANSNPAFQGPAARRFMCCPRDLATYVHDDALYQAYLNACLILLGMGSPFDPGFSNLAGQKDDGVDLGALFRVEPGGSHVEIARQAGGFALFGGPHILTLVTEVATRALKAVRFQKFNVHIRLRPETLAGRIELAGAIETAHPHIGSPFSDLGTAVAPTLAKVQAVTGNNLLPMAFQEGSPMHPAYGAGHATVAGACVTILKAFFDTSAVFVRRGSREAFLRPVAGDTLLAYAPDDAGATLVAETGTALTLEGELNKLAANISIGRNMAGVHYYSDYYDSLRMGEEIAIGMLEEQALGYKTDPFVLSVPTFDGDVVRIGAR